MTPEELNEATRHIAEDLEIMERELRDRFSKEEDEVYLEQVEATLNTIRGLQCLVSVLEYQTRKLKH